MCSRTGAGGCTNRSRHIEEQWQRESIIVRVSRQAYITNQLPVTGCLSAKYFATLSAPLNPIMCCRTCVSVRRCKIARLKAGYIALLGILPTHPDGGDWNHRSEREPNEPWD